jgi:aminoglycoside phosphotransferase (APT) family kinase protein
VSEASDVAEALARTLEPVLGGSVRIDELRRLSGGASRETWAFSVGERELILRRDPPGRPGMPGSMALEADAMRACVRAGLLAPRVLVDDDGSTLGTAGLVMERVPGETIARRILRDDEFAKARTVLAGQLGRFFAGLHSIDPAEVPGLQVNDPLVSYREAYGRVDDVSPTFDAAFRWLEANRPEPTGDVIVHGDLRLGNVIVDPDGLAAVIDWELVHRGDPLEDLAWVCVKAWRFGSALPVAGVGTFDELFEAYGDVDREAFHWWLVLCTLKWGVGCMGQAAAHLSGAVRSVELAAIGRRVAEQEWDLLELLAPEARAAALAEPTPAPAPPEPGLHGRPTAVELLEAAREFLTDDVMRHTEGRLQFHARVTANVLATVQRELELGPAQESRYQLGAKPGEDESAFLARSVRDRLLVANPKHLTTP